MEKNLKTEKTTIFRLLPEEVLKESESVEAIASSNAYLVDIEELKKYSKCYQHPEHPGSSRHAIFSYFILLLMSDSTESERIYYMSLFKDLKNTTKEV